MTSALLQAQLVSVLAFDGQNESDILALAAGLAPWLEEPWATAITAASRDRDLEVAPADQRPVIRESSVTGSVSGRSVSVSSSAAESVDPTFEWAERLRQRGQTVLFVTVNGRLAGLLGMWTEGRIDASFPTGTAGLPDALKTEVIDLSDEARIVLRVSPVTVDFGGRPVRMLSYNGSIPGPTLRVGQGTSIIVDVINEGDLDTTVHWHGLRLDNRYDGTTATQRPIEVGGRFTYRLTFPDPGVYWYHPHIREDYGQEMGLYGNVIVVPADPAYWPPVNRELTLTVDDILLEQGGVASFEPTQPTYTAMGRYGNTMLINGASALSLNADTGEVVRFYLTNTANARVFNLALAGARMKLVGGDSGRVEQETFVEKVVLAPSERAVVDVLFDRVGSATLENQTPNGTTALATIAVGDSPIRQSFADQFEQLRLNQDLTAERVRLGRYLLAEPDKTLSLVAEMHMDDATETGPGAFVCPMHPDVTSEHAGRCPKCGMKLISRRLVEAGMQSHHDHGQDHGHHAAGPSTSTSYPAGIEWEDDMIAINRMTNPSNMRWKLIDRETGAEGLAIDWKFRVGDRVKIRLVNEMDSDHPMQHPFHIHGAGRFLVLSRDGAPEPNLAWNDTVLVPTGQTVDILLDVTHPGVWMAHCHIAEHHESGMMLRFFVQE